MTLPTLISKMSGRTPRFVTVAGRILSGTDVVATGNGHHHPDHGRVTPVRRHHNHGGEPPEEDAAEPWWEQDPALLEAEQIAMAEAFPDFVRTEYAGRPAWRGVLDTGRGRYEVTIVHRPDHGLPHVVPSHPSLFRRKEGRRFSRSPHLYRNGHLCVAGRDDWEPNRDDAVTVVAWAAHWLAAFTEWRITGRGWPSDGVDVDAA